MPSALFVSQCHHFSPLIYFIAISVLLAPSPTLPTTAPPPSLAQHHLHLHLRLRAFATTGFSSFTCLPTADTPPPPRRSSQAFHPGPSVSSTARSLARAASTNTFARNSPPLRNAIPRSPRRSFGFIIPFCPFSFLSSRPDTAVLRSPPPPPLHLLLLTHFLLYPRRRRAATAFPPSVSRSLFPSDLPFLSRARINAYRISPSSPSHSCRRVFVRCSVSCCTSGTRRETNVEQDDRRSWERGNERDEQSDGRDTDRRNATEKEEGTRMDRLRSECDEETDIIVSKL